MACGAFEVDKDDPITLSSPESPEPSLMFPVPIEDAVNSHPEVKSALVLGNGKRRPALLVVANEQSTEEQHYISAQRLVGDVV
ncbi:MAG: hypothetical protein Q9196_006157 [Gyalolechia fulgens]